MADVPLMNNPMTTAQDIIKGGTAGAPARLAVGSNGDVLTVTAGAVGWAAPSAGSGKLAVIAETVVAGSPAANFDFTSISGSYRHLQLRIQARSDTAATFVTVNMTFNNDSGSNYDWQRSTVTNTTGANGATAATTSLRAGLTTAASATSNNPGQCVIDINNYAATVFFKTFLGNSIEFEGTTAATFVNERNCGQWRSTSAITRITLTPSAGSWIVGSTATLYGYDD